MTVPNNICKKKKKLNDKYEQQQKANVQWVTWNDVCKVKTTFSTLKKKEKREARCLI